MKKTPETSAERPVVSGYSALSSLGRCISQCWLCDCCFPHSCNRAQEDAPGLQEDAEKEVRLWNEGHAPTSGCFSVLGDSSRDPQGNTSCVQSCGETSCGETGQNSLALPAGLRLTQDSSLILRGTSPAPRGSEGRLCSLLPCV